MLASNPSDHSERSDLVRGLGLGSAIAIVIGDTIGTGVFLVASDMARAVGSATLVSDRLDPRLAHRAFGRLLLCRTRCGFSEGRRPLRLPWPGARPSLGISLWLDEFVSRAASRYGHSGGRFRAVPGIFVSHCGHAFVQQSHRALRIHVHDGPADGGVDRGDGDGGQLFQCADGWRYPGAANVAQGGHKS